MIDINTLNCGTITISSVTPGPEPGPTVPDGKVLYKTAVDGEWLQDDANISSGAFNGFATVDKTSAVEVIIPSKDSSGNDVTSIGQSAFQNCNRLTSVTIPDSVTSIGNYTFFYCTGLTSITIPDSVTSIGKETFKGCSGLTSVEIPNSVTSIRDGVFYNCIGLTSVTIGNGVESIGKLTFSGCNRLTSVTFLGKTLEQVQAMDNYPWSISDTSIINVA